MAKKKALIILGGGLAKDTKGRWKMTDYDEGDNFGAMGDRVRAKAAGYLSHQYPLALLIASGGKGQYKDVADAPTVASVVKEELIAQGVPSTRIIKEEKSGNTYQQLFELSKLIKKKRIEEIHFISNDWHLPRIKAIIDCNKKLKNILGKIKMEFVSAEKIVLSQDKNYWQPIIDKAYKSPALRRRIELEKSGIEQLKKGIYKFS